MINQNQPIETTTTPPATPTSVESVSAVQSTAPPTPPPVESPTVVVPPSGGEVPRWFYFVFGATLIVFFVVTVLLVMQLTQTQESTNIQGIPTIAISPTPRLVASPTVTPTSEDAAILKLTSLGSSDEITAIETDLENTDLSILDKGQEELNL